MSLSPDQQRELQVVFQTFDKDNKGQLSVEECAIAMRALGFDPPSGALRQCDLNGFTQLFCSYSQHLVDKEPMLYQALRVFDTSGQGWADTQTLGYWLTYVGEPFNQNEMRRFESDCLPQQGQVDLAAFARRLMFKQ